MRCEGAGDRVETGRVDNDVEIRTRRRCVLMPRVLIPLGVMRFDRRLVDVHQFWTLGWL